MAQVDSTYYNTTGLRGEELSSAKRQANKGDRLVLDVLNQYPNKAMSATRVQLIIIRSKCREFSFRTDQLTEPILHDLKRVLGSTDSIKRSLNTLYERGVIERLEKKIKGAWGKPEFTYRVIK